VQEVILELWNKKDSLEVNTSLFAYLKRSVYNRSLNFIKSRAKIASDEQPLLLMKDKEDSIEEELYGSEMASKLNKVIESLPEKCRHVFALSRFEEKTYNEIAEMLDISSKTVENQISKALKILRNAMLVNT
jgi:RNA polymerase sigma-70 factor (ECF subfamily)